MRLIERNQALNSRDHNLRNGPEGQEYERQHSERIIFITSQYRQQLSKAGDVINDL